MFRCNRITGGFTRSLVSTAIVMTITCGTAWAQAALDTRVIEFLPSQADGTILADGRAAVTEYQIAISVAGTSQLLQMVTLGKPSVDPDGMVRVNIASQLLTPPAAGVQYSARIVAVGPNGATTSIASNSFAFNTCQFGLTSQGTSIPTAGGGASVDVAVSSGSCSWNAVSSDAWLTVVSGGAGLGNGSVAFTVPMNPTAVSRVATLTVGSMKYSVTQAGAAPRTVQVSTEPELQAAVAALTSNTTIVIAPGRYRLSATLQIAGDLTGVTVKGSTGLATDVVIEGAGMTVAGDAPTGVRVSGKVQDLQIADLTIRQFSVHAILFDEGPQAPHLSNLRLADSGDALIRATPGAGGVDDGLVERSLLAYTTTGASASAAGIDLRGASGWIIRSNWFLNVRAPTGALARPAVSASAGSSDTKVEQNLFLNCQRAVALGLADLAGGFDHSGGRVTNNFIYRGAAVAGGAGISVADSPNTTVAHNTVIMSATYPTSIEYQYQDAAELIVANNLVDGTIQAKDGASAVESGNVTNATRELFVNAAVGDLHLRPTAIAAIDVGNAYTLEPIDIDGNSRPLDGAPDAGADEIATSNAPPTILIVPPALAVVPVASAVRFEATAQDSDGSVVVVHFYANSALIASVSQAPFVAGWTIAQAGTYSIVAIAVDNAGGRTTSEPVSVTAGKGGL